MRWTGLRAALAHLASACKPHTPEIGRDLPTNIEEASTIFGARVKATYSEGTSEERLVDELRRQGFVLKRQHADWKCAVFTRRSLLINTNWSVCWRAENGTIASIGGTYHLLAP
jgi:hypothetical protein